ncbi:MAG: hypothetical protein HYZ75_14570 [Elusimicrobia bacterium]|nr:hypothetical protein [Elusimicrobiota bacterium]
MVKAAALALTLAPVRVPLTVPPGAAAPLLAPATLSAPSLAAPSLVPTFPSLPGSPAARPSALSAIAAPNAVAEPSAPAPLSPAQAVLARAEAAGLPRERVAEALAKAKDAPAALRSLGAMGLLPAREMPADAVDSWSLLSRLWDQASGAPRHEIDASWPLPSLVVRRSEAVYHVHPLAHGQLMPNDRGRVVELARAVEEAGGEVYFEHNLPAFYGVTSGREVRDHAAAAGGVPEILPADRPETRAAARRRAAEAVLVPGTLVLPLAWLAYSPLDAGAWLLLAALGAFVWAAMTSLRPLRRWGVLRDAAEASRLGFTDLAEQLTRQADVYFADRVDPAELGRLEPPLTLVDAGDAIAVRSAAQADAAAADAAARGVRQVHLVVGYRHAYHAADRLAAAVPIPGTSEADEARGRT